MKTNKYITLGALALAIGFSSCDDYLDVNTDPNQAADAPLSNVMTSSMVSLMMGHSGEDARLAAMWSQHFTGSDRQYSAFDIYNVTTAEFDWEKYYFGITEQAKIANEKATAQGNMFYSGLAKIIQAHSYGMITSLWGDVPYSEANKFPDIVEPTFDGQAAVYSAVQSLLDNAISDLQSGVGSDNAGVDLFYNGDAAAWIKLANTLKARFYMHTGEYGNAITAAGNGIDASAGDWNTVHTGGGYNQDINVYNSFGVSDREGYLTADGAHLPKLLDATNAMYRGHAKTNESARFNFIYSTATAGIDYDLNYAGMFTATSPFPLATALETQLIAAEANARLTQTVAALTSLNAARTLLAAQFPTGQYDAYLITDFIVGGIEDNGLGGDNANLMYEIVEERYASLVGQIEAFNDIRRTDNMIGLTPKAGSQIPERFLYPADEINSNSNAPAVKSLFTPTAVNM